MLTALDLDYSYNSNSQITAILDASTPGIGAGWKSHTTTGLQYDGLGQMTHANGWWGSGLFTYDGLGNLLSKSLTTGGSPRSVNLNYDPAKNHLSTSIDSLMPTHGGTGTRALTHDDRGNLTTSTFVDFFGGINRTKTMTYDLSDQMIAMSGQVPDGSPVNGTFEYNGEGKRVQMTMNGRNSFYVYDFAGRLMLSHKEADGEGVERLYLESGQALGKWTGTKLTYFHTDHLGTPIRGTHGMGGTETVGADVFQQFQTPYGMQPTTSWHGTGNTGFDPAFGQGSNCGVTGFTTHANDCETGLTYMQARYYDPVSSRFTSVDPVTFTNTGNTGMINRYGYVENDPISFLDPYGTDKVHISVGGYFVAGIGYTVNLGVAVDFSPERRTGFLPDISIYSTTGRQGGFGGGVGVDLGYFRGGNEDFYGRGSQLVGDTPAIGITLSEPNSSTEFNNSGDIAVGLGYAAGLTGGEVNTRNLFSTKDFANTIDMLIGGEVSSSNASNLASRYLGKDIEVTQVDSSTQTFSFTRTGSRLKQKVTCKSSGDGTSSC